MEIHRDQLLLRSETISLKDQKAQYFLEEVYLKPGDALESGMPLAKIRVTRVTKKGDEEVEETTCITPKFTTGVYTSPRVMEVLVEAGTNLDAGKLTLLHYEVESSFANLIETLVAKSVKTPSGLHFGTAIPAKKLTNAIEAYADGVEGTRVVLLHDATIWGSAKAGFLITDSGMYFRHDPVRFDLRFHDIASCQVEEETSDDGAVKRTLMIECGRDKDIRLADGTGSIDVTALKELLDFTRILTTEGLTKEVDGFVIIEEMPEIVKRNYLLLLVWLTYHNDHVIDSRELMELQVLMTQLNFDPALRHAVRSATIDPYALDPVQLAGEMQAAAPTGSEEALGISLVKDAVRVFRSTSEGSAQHSDGVRTLADLFTVNEEQLKFVEEACVQDERILAGEISDSQIAATAKDLAGKAAAIGVPITAVYLSGSVVGLSAAGISSGLATLGLGGILGFSSMVTGIGAAILIGVGIYKGVQWATGGAQRDKATRRELMLQEVLRMHQRAISNLAEDIAYLGSRILDLTRQKGEHQLLIDKLARELTLFMSTLGHLRTREEGFEGNLRLEIEKRMT